MLDAFIPPESPSQYPTKISSAFSISGAASDRIMLALNSEGTMSVSLPPRKEAGEESGESLRNSLDSRNFRIAVTPDWKRRVDSDEGTEYLEHPSGDVWMVESTGEQYFMLESALRETRKAGLRMPTVEEWKRIIRSVNPKIDLERGRQADTSVREGLRLELNSIFSTFSAPYARRGLGAYLAHPNESEKFYSFVMISETEITLMMERRASVGKKVGYSVRCFRKAE
jgi:hypothetical protein